MNQNDERLARAIFGDAHIDAELAAAKATERAEALAGAPVQHFETEPDGAYEAEMGYERYLERGDDDSRRDLEEHERQWPNGYGRCPEGRCQRGVYHPGEHIEDPRRAGYVDALELAARNLTQEYYQDANRRND